MTIDRMNELDREFLPLCKDMDNFTEEDSIVRIGAFGYVTEEIYESMFESERERKEYQALSNIEIKFYMSEDIEKEVKIIEEMSDESLDYLLEKQITTQSCEVYYTNGEG